MSRFAIMSDCKDPQNRSKKDCCCGSHSANDRKKSKTHHNTAAKIQIRKSRQVKAEFKFTHETCPKSDTWFADGGRCGWAHECDKCVNGPIV